MAAMVVAPKPSRLERNTRASCFSSSQISTRRNSTGSSPSRASRGKLMIWSRNRAAHAENDDAGTFGLHRRAQAAGAGIGEVVHVHVAAPSASAAEGAVPFGAGERRLAHGDGERVDGM